MLLALKIYLIGFVAAFLFCIKTLEDEGKVGIDDVLFSFMMGLLSWIGFIALVLGSKLKNHS
jgi:hypothetical protein